MSFNKLTSLAGVDKLSQLRVLLAAGNQLTGSLPSVLGELTNLLVLDLSNNQLDGPSVTPLSTMQSLSTLRLSHNKSIHAGAPTPI